MKFRRLGRFHFEDTPRKRAAVLLRRKREQEAAPLFAAQIAEAQSAEPGVDEVMAQRATATAESTRNERAARAQNWRKARQEIFSMSPDRRTRVFEVWRSAPYPADPVYLLGLLHDLRTGRIDLAQPPWALTSEEVAEGRRRLAEFSRKLEQLREEFKNR